MLAGDFLVMSVEMNRPTLNIFSTIPWFMSWTNVHPKLLLLGYFNTTTEKETDILTNKEIEEREEEGGGEGGERQRHNGQQFLILKRIYAQLLRGVP